MTAKKGEENERKILKFSIEKLNRKLFQFQLFQVIP